MEQQLMPCPHCGAANFSSSSECYQCTSTLHAETPWSPMHPVALQPVLPAAPPQPASPLSHGVAFTLSMFLGFLGVDRLYLGKIGTGLLKMGSFLSYPLAILLMILTAKAGKPPLLAAGIFVLFGSVSFVGSMAWWLVDLIRLGSGTEKDAEGLPLVRNAEVVGTPRKEQSTAFALAYFLGMFGASDFYLGRTGYGLARLALLVAPSLLFPFLLAILPDPLALVISMLPFTAGVIWKTVDIMRIGMGKGRDAQGNSLIQPSAGPRIAAQPVHMLPMGFQQQPSPHHGSAAAWGQPAAPPTPPESPTAPQ